MTDIFNFFSNREIAIIVWIVIAVVYFLSFKESRKGIVDIAKPFADKKVLTAIALMIGYITIIVFVFYKVGLWDVVILKDTVFWFCTFALVVFVNSSKLKENSQFKAIILKSARWTCVVEFVINFYTFPLPMEMVVVPFISIAVLMQAFTEVYSKSKGEYVVVNKATKKVLGYAVAVVVLYVLYKTITAYKALLTIENVKSLLLPPIFTLLFLPFLYVLALYMQYGEIFAGLGVMTNDKARMKRIKWAILMAAGTNLDDVTYIDRNMRKGELYNSASEKKYFMDLIKRRRGAIGENNLLPPTETNKHI